uniref:Uncharacterized protein n=1 Tax=Davidia involucrata TaxID=16924 RepID=A0A5B7BZ21_DAVIN
MKNQRVSRFEERVESLIVGHERMMKEMREMFQAINSRFDQLVANRGCKMGESSVYPKIGKLNFSCYNGKELNFSYHKESKEPPQKVELKKIPIKRAISPKLERHTSSNLAPNNSSEGDESCLGPRMKREQSKSPKGIQASYDKDIAASKKPIRKSQSKLQSQGFVFTTTERKPINLEGDYQAHVVIDLFEFVSMKI